MFQHPLATTTLVEAIMRQRLAEARSAHLASGPRRRWRRRRPLAEPVRLPLTSEGVVREQRRAS